MTDPTQGEQLDTSTKRIKIVAECLEEHAGNPRFLGTPVTDYLKALAAERDEAVAELEKLRAVVERLPTEVAVYTKEQDDG